MTAQERIDIINKEIVDNIKSFLQEKKNEDILCSIFVNSKTKLKLLYRPSRGSFIVIRDEESYEFVSLEVAVDFYQSLKK